MWQVIDTKMLVDHLKKLDRIVTAGQAAIPRRVATLMFTAICKSNSVDFYYQDVIRKLLHDNYNATPKDFQDVMSIVYAILSGVAGDYKYRGLHVLEAQGKIYVALKNKPV